MRHYRDFKDYHVDKLKDPEEARAYLELALEDYATDGDREEFLLAVQDVAEAQGEIRKLTGQITFNCQDLYKALSKKGDPQMKTVDTLLHTVGFRLSVAPLEPHKEPAAVRDKM